MFTVEETKATTPVSSEPTHGGFPIEIGRLWRAVVQSRRLLFAGTLAFGIAGAALAKTVVPRTYESTAVLHWEPPPGDDPPDARDLKTMAARVKLPENLATTRERLGLETTLVALGGALEVAVEKDSNLLTIKASADEPEPARELAEAATEVFLVTSANSQKTRIEEDVERLELRVHDARRAVEEVRGQYDQFRQQYGITDLPRERELALDHAARLRSEADLSRAEARAQDVRAEQLMISATRIGPTAVLAEKELRPDLERLGSAHAELIGMGDRLSEEHPRVMALSAEVSTLGATSESDPIVVRSERTVGRNPSWDTMQAGLAEAEADRAAAEMKEEMYERMADDATDIVARLVEVESQAVTLLSRVKVAENHLVESEQLLTWSRDTLRSPPPTFRVIAKPAASDLPASSPRRLVAIASPILGLMLMLAFAMGRALWGLRLCSSREIAFWTKNPVIASTSWPLDSDALNDAVLDLEAVLPEGPGEVLLVGIDSASRRAARTLAARVSKRKSRSETEEIRDPNLSAPAVDATLNAVRRAARRADRVVVVVESGKHSILRFKKLSHELGRSDLAFLLIGVGPDLAQVADQVGDVRRFSALLESH